MPRSLYRRLSHFAGVRVFGRQSLWLGPDHLLLVENFSFVERYRRFFLSDIQVLLTQRTAAGSIANGVLLALLIGLGLLLWWIKDHEARLVLACVPGTLLALMLLYNLVRGPTCRFYIQTAVGRVHAPCISRLRRAKKIVQRLRPLIENVQPPVTEAERAAYRAAADLASVSVPPAPPAVPTVMRDSRLHAYVFMLLMGYGVLNVVGIFYAHVVLAIVSVLVDMGLGVMTVVALVRRRRYRVKPRVARLTWGVLAVFLMGMAAGYVFQVMIVVRHPEFAGNQWRLFKYLAGLTAQDDPFLLVVCCVMAMAALMIGSLGLVAVLRPAREA